MKKLILGLALMLTFAFTQAQKIDSLYVADSALIIHDIDLGITAEAKIPTNTSFLFKIEDKRSKLEIRQIELLRVFVVDTIASVDHYEDARVVVYKGTVGSVTYYLGVTTLSGKLFAVGLFAETGEGVIFFITSKGQSQELIIKP